MAEALVLVRYSESGVLQLVGMVYNNKNELVDLQHETANVWEEVTKFVRKIYRKHNVKPTIQFV